MKQVETKAVAKALFEKLRKYQMRAEQGRPTQAEKRPVLRIRAALLVREVKKGA